MVLLKGKEGFMKITIKPNILNGTIEIPPSKSYSHRAVIAAALAEGGKKSKIDNLKFSVDITTTTDIMENWGAKINREESSLDIIGNGGKIVPKDKYVQCNESGSTIRFLIPIGITSENELIFDGKGKLVDRPLDSYYRIFDKQGIFSVIHLIINNRVRKVFDIICGRNGAYLVI